VARLVAGGLGDVLGVVAERVGEDHARRVVLAADHAVDTDVGDAAAGAPDGHDARRDEHAVAVLLVRARGPDEEGFAAAHVLGGDVDVEGRVILGDPCPDLLYVGLLSRREGAGGPVPVGWRGGDGRMAGVVPRRTAEDVAIEVEIDDLRCSGATVEFEDVCGCPPVRGRRIFKLGQVLEVFQ
jgi:hypothetical protein